MSISINNYRGPEVVTWKHVPPLMGHLSFADRSFKAVKHADQSSFYGGGLYGVLLDDRLVYVGKFRGRKSDWLSGNVVESRWIKHIGTFTMLDRKLSFSPKAFDSVMWDILSVDNSIQGLNELATGLANSNTQIITRDMGLSSTYARFQIAKQLWSESFLESDWLNRFSFIYARLDKCADTATARRTISLAEELAIATLQPRANSIPNSQRKYNGQSSIDEVKAAFVTSLTCASEASDISIHTNKVIHTDMTTNPTSLSSTYIDDESLYEISRESMFYESIEGAPVEFHDFITRLVEHIETYPNASIEFTGNDKTPYQLRIRKHTETRRGFINAITLTWRRSKTNLLMRHLLPESILQSAGLSAESSGNDPLKYASLITTEVARKHQSQLIDLINQAIEMR